MPFLAVWVLIGSARPSGRAALRVRGGVPSVWFTPGGSEPTLVLHADALKVGEGHVLARALAPLGSFLAPLGSLASLRGVDMSIQVVMLFRVTATLQYVVNLPIPSHDGCSFPALVSTVRFGHHRQQGLSPYDGGLLRATESNERVWVWVVVAAGRDSSEEPRPLDLRSVLNEVGATVEYRCLSSILEPRLAQGPAVRVSGRLVGVAGRRAYICD